MPATSLYLADALDPDAFEAALMVMQMVKAIIGIGIAYIAYRGYRNNRSRPMFYLALGFVLVLGLPFVLYLGGLSLLALVGLAAVGQAGLIALAEVSQILGLVAILYALRL